MSIADLLVPVLEERFPEHGLRTGSPPEPVAVFPAACAEVGDVSIYDHDDEATVYIQNVTHFHVSPYDESLSEIEAARWIVDGVVGFLDDLFADRVLLWSLHQGRSGGTQPHDGEIPADVPPDADVFLWSRRIR